MKLKRLQLICVGILFCTTTVFANVQINERKSFRESEMNVELFSFREHAKLEMRNNRTPISARQSNTATHRLDAVVGNGWKLEFEYDDNGNVIVEFLYSDDANEKREYTFDSNGNMMMEILYTWNWENSAWRESVKTEHTFDSNGNDTMHIVSNWVENAWVENLKRERTFDSNGNLTMVVAFRWVNNAWVESSKVERTFDSNGNQTMQVMYNWINNVWVGFLKTEHTFDSNGNQTMLIVSNWENNAWRESIKTEHTLDSNGNTTMATIYRWENNAWRQIAKTENEFDLSVSMSDIFRPNFLRAGLAGTDLQNFNKIISGTQYSWWNNAWFEGSTQTFHYSEISTNIPSISASSFTIFPNPVLDNFTISGITENTLVKITDLNGRIVMQQTVAPSEQISVGHLSAGVYFVRVNEETVKIVKR